MNRVMQNFKRQLLSYDARIKKAAYLLRLEVEDHEDGFTLTGHWNDGHYSRRYNPSYVMGRFATMTPDKQRPKTRICWFRDEFVRAALAARGI